MSMLRSLIKVAAAAAVLFSAHSPILAQTPFASLKVTADGIQPLGLRSLSGADGETKLQNTAGQPCVTTKSGSNYLYFSLDANVLPNPIHGPIYVRIEYYDNNLGTSMDCQYDSTHGDSIDSKFFHSEDQAGGYLYGTHQWRKAVFLLKDPMFAHRENLGADFRISGGALSIRAVAMFAEKPEDWAEAGRIEKLDIKPLVKIGPGGQLIVGGFDPARVQDAAPQAKALESSIPVLKQIGVTSHECYVRWNLCEPTEGKYDWSVYDRYVEIYKRNGIKWVPFLIFGSAYSLPDWYYKKPGSQGYICLEHHQECDVQSHWNPVLRRHLARFIKAFCAHYRSSGVIESILLGITGNYGEAIYPVSGNDWTADIHGNYHSHPGFWAGDPYAIEDYRKFIKARYGTTEALGKAWGKNFAGDIETIKPELKVAAPSDRAWLDQCSWYIGAMTSYTRFWLREVRTNFPQGNIYVCTGGHAPAEHGADFGDQCKVAAEFGAGVRITNESSDEAGNFSLTRWVASAGRQYGSYFSFEPAGNVDVNGVVARVFNASTSGARGLHYYYPNLFAENAARENFIRTGGQFIQRQPVAEIAVYYPETYILLHDNDFLRYAQILRRRTDFDYMSDGQIRDGGLKRIKALVLMEGSVSEASTWKGIADWVQAGGVLFYATGMGQLKTVEGDTWPDKLVQNQSFGKGTIVRYEGPADDSAYIDLIAKSLIGTAPVSPLTKLMLGSARPGLFTSVAQSGELVLFNSTNEPITVNQVTTAPHTIISVQPGGK